MKEQLTAVLTKMRAIAAAAEADGDRDFTAEERQQLDGFMAEAKALKDKIKAAEGDADIKRQIAALGDGIGLVEPTATEIRRVVAGRGNTLGDRVANHPEMRAFLARLAQMPQGAKGIQSPYIQFASLLTGDSATSGGAMVFADIQPDVTMLGRAPLTLRQIVTNGTTTSDTVEYVRETSETNAAAPVAEASATSGSTGTKPESAMAFEQVTTPVQEIGHWIPATKRAVSDAGQLRTMIDSFLRYGLESNLEDQMVNGNGQGQNLTGIGNTSGIQTQAWDTDEFVTLRRAKTKVEQIGMSTPTAYLMNAYNWETIDLKKDKNDRFYGPGPFSEGTPRLWGLPVVISTKVPNGVAYCGDFRQAVLWDREQASVSMSDSHSDFFIRGLLAIVASMRAAFGVRKPSAFVEIDLSVRS